MTIAMKKLFITIMGLLVVLSCGQKPNSSSDDVSDEPIDDGTEEVEATKPLELKTYTFSDTLGMAHVDISIEFPVKGEKKLVNAIRRYLSDVILQESDEADQADGKSLADHHGKFHMERMKELAAQYEGDDYVTEVFYDWSFIKNYEDDRVVTFLTLTSLYEGGHPWHWLPGGRHLLQEKRTTLRLQHAERHRQRQVHGSAARGAATILLAQ